MAEEDEFYFEEYDNDDNAYAEDEDGGAVAETWEHKLEFQYATAKSMIDSNPAEAISMFREAMAEDQDKGRWTFKCLKMMARTYQRSRNYDDMSTTLDRLIRFQYSGLTRQDKEKSITKFMDRCSQLPQEVMLNKVLLVTLRYLNEPANQQTMEKLWSQVSLKRIAVLLNERLWDDALKALEPLEVWVRDDALQRKGTQLTQIYAAKLQIYSEKHQSSHVRDAYQGACDAMQAAITPPRTAGIIKEYGGKLLMRLGLWSEATDAFNLAFRSFDEAGDSRRLANLRYLVLCTMMSGSKVDPLASNETKTYANDPDVQCMTQLIRASDRNDLVAFDAVLTDDRMVAILNEDLFLDRYLQPLIAQVRQQVLLAFVKPYSQVRVSRIAEVLKVKVEEAHALCMSSILDGRLVGQLDEVTGVLRMAQSASKDETARNAIFHSIVEWNELLRKEQEAIRVNCWTS